MRQDGTRVKDLTPIMQALPYIMPRRFDAQNWASDYVDEEIMKRYIRQKRREGHSVTHMSVLAAAYYKAALEHPKVNYFVMNRKIYERNHFCFSFVILKTRADGTPDETTLKIFLEPEDTVLPSAARSRSTLTSISRRPIITIQTGLPALPSGSRPCPGWCSVWPIIWISTAAAP